MHTKAATKKRALSCWPSPDGSGILAKPTAYAASRVLGTGAVADVPTNPLAAAMGEQDTSGQQVPGS